MHAGAFFATICIITSINVIDISIIFTVSGPAAQAPGISVNIQPLSFFASPYLNCLFVQIAVYCKYTVYKDLGMICSWKHKGLKKFFETGSTAGIQAKHAPRLRLQLAILHAATSPKDLNLPGYSLHKLKGSHKDHYSISVSGNWRLVFAFEGENAILVNYLDYH